MTRQEILSQYDVGANGRIKTPGKFEGEMLYVPHFWGIFLDGFADRDDGEVLGFDLTKEDREEFPELKGRRTVKIMATEQGFVVEV